MSAPQNVWDLNAEPAASALVQSIAFYVDGVEYEPGAGAEMAVNPDSLYELMLTFKETPEYQFDGTAITYALPSGFSLPDDFSMDIAISLGRKGVLCNNPVTYDKEHNTLAIAWNKTDEEGSAASWPPARR